MTLADGDPTIPVRIEMRNLRQGQLIEMDVVGDWTEAALLSRLEHVVSVRQPTEIRLRLPVTTGALPAPDLDRIHRLLAEMGGTMLVELIQGDSGEILTLPP